MTNPQLLSTHPSVAPAKRRERDDILRVRAPALCFYVLRDSNGLYLIDGGFIGGRYLLASALRRRGWNQEPIRGIIVTHGHLDHILNVASIAKDSGAWIAAPRLDAAHYEGRFPYRGVARVCGLLEAIGRRLFSYSPFKTDRWLDDYTEIPVWHGLTAIHLPGHTNGHTGLYCHDLKLLFCADLFASYGTISHPPPAIFNSRPELIRSSIARALTLDLEGVIPNHCDAAPSSEHLKRLRRLKERLGR
jgi:glyoxylase-like metal-dependent hydrolase (beta-lactamase superfamily II)